MSEREYYRETDSPTTNQRDTYYERETSDPATAPLTTDAAREVHREQVSGVPGGYVRQSEHVQMPSAETRQAATAARINQIISFVFGVISVLIGIRFLLLLLGAGQASGFVQLVYNVSQPFVAPFLGIFGEPGFGNSVIEWASLIAIVIYMLIGYGITRMVRIAYAPTRRVARDL